MILDADRMFAGIGYEFERSSQSITLFFQRDDGRFLTFRNKVFGKNSIRYSTRIAGVTEMCPDNYLWIPIFAYQKALDGLVSISEQSFELNNDRDEEYVNRERANLDTEAYFIMKAFINPEFTALAELNAKMLGVETTTV